MLEKNSKPKFKAVLFDMGGVVLKYLKSGTTTRIQNEVTSDHIASKKLMMDFELGLKSLEEILPLANYLFNYDIPTDIDFENYDHVNLISKKNDAMILAIKKLRENGYTIGLLTNNGFLTKQQKNTLILKEIELFDYIQESCILGVRKPDAEFYKIAVENLKVDYSECIFLDDLQLNCDGAQQLGIQSILVEEGKTNKAINELENLLNLKLT